MRIHLKIVLLLLTTELVLSAQESRRGIVNPSKNPADDAKPNSPSVPDV
jgi:hypothetical protein